MKHYLILLLFLAIAGSSNCIAQEKQKSKKIHGTAKHRKAPDAHHRIARHEPAAIAKKVVVKRHPVAHHHKVAAKHHTAKHVPVIKEQMATVGTGASRALVEIKNGSVYVNDSLVFKIKSLKNEDDKIAINYTAPPPPVADKPKDERQGEANDEGSHRPVLGVYLCDYYDEGALVTDVVPGSPADDAGLYPGYVITQINDKEVNSAEQLVDAIDALKPGDKATINYRCHCRKETTEAIIGDAAKMERCREDDCCNCCEGW